MITNLKVELYVYSEIQLSERGYLSSDLIGLNSHYIGRNEVGEIITGIRKEVL